MSQSRTIVLDNGASTLKVGFADETEAPKIIPNAIIRSKGDKETYFGHEIERCTNFASLNYRIPFQKGLLTDWDAQKAIWDGIFSPGLLNVDTSAHSILVTEPYFNLPNIQDVYDQMIFEEYEFESYMRCSPASLIPYGTMFKSPEYPHAPECMIIVDAGFSFTHVVPLMNGSVVWNAVQRIDVGGKLLTNHLKELVSFRQWNMMDETWIVNEIKEACCYVSDDYHRDLETCRVDPKKNPILQEYILPDFSSAVTRHGRIREGPTQDRPKDDDLGDAMKGRDHQRNREQLLLMGNERFAVPELLFRPDDVGLDQLGLPRAIARSISLLPEDVRGMFWANVGLVGGSTLFPGLQQRLTRELRALAPPECEVMVHTCERPITEAFHAGRALASSPGVFGQAGNAIAVTRAEYAEGGSSACRRKFQRWDWHLAGRALKRKASRGGRRRGGAK
ncbi:actin-like protein ARP6 [Punctularia strigosozonata HHB-11173 SS5]|uniref:actin-like protein ARP6 n=1 Tax=Punctularia strigosozonata (strain HHB-11173) TaxID=741275 RepID=UPI0004416DCC|nr:actin-like protein ARP6 [Punctularia strigosozonata HHB-11173 SS5]EIN12805.1 actin-like protein ARP6 [Punctularia strigosozonata HHB-11173 SS5]